MLLEMSVGSHGHGLVAVDMSSEYICDGCNEKGTGLRYRCHGCNYDMHNLCASAPPSILQPLISKDMRLLSTHLEGRDSLWCSACEKSVCGLRYYGGGDALHPSCARLPKSHTINSTTFHLSKSLSTDPCNMCGQKNRGWAYVSRDYSVHVHCLIEALMRTPANSDDFQSSSHQTHFQLTAAPTSTSEASTSLGALQKKAKRRSNHGVVRTVICTTTRLLLKLIYVLFFGDPSCLLGEIGTMIANN